MATPPIHTAENEVLSVDTLKALEEKPAPIDERTKHGLLEEPPLPTTSGTETQKTYLPLLDTIRLYAAWFLAWYLLLFHLGMYQTTRSLPFSLPLVEEIYASLFVATVALAAFLMLLLSTIHRKIKGGTLTGLLFTLLGASLVILFWIRTS